MEIKDLEYLHQIFGNQHQMKYLKMTKMLLSFLLINKKYIHIKMMEKQLDVIKIMGLVLDVYLKLEFLGILISLSYLQPPANAQQVNSLFHRCLIT